MALERADRVHTPEQCCAPFHQFLVVSYEVVMSLVMNLPRYGAFNRAKCSFLRMRGAKVGRDVTIYPRVWVSPGGGLDIGDHVDLALGVMITTKGGVRIGERTLVGYNTCIFSANHAVPDRLSRIFDAGSSCAPVVIGHDVWIGANCTILPGVEVGDGAVVAAGSVVTKSIPSFAVFAGVPAKLIRFRD